MQWEIRGELNNAARTLLLFVSAAVLAYAFGIWLGKQVAWNPGGLFEVGAVIGGVLDNLLMGVADVMVLLPGAPGAEIGY